MFRTLSTKTLRKAAMAVGLPVALMGVVVLQAAPVKPVISHGPIQSGHAEISCQGCHTPSAGTTRQQIQANLNYVLGRRETHADFGYGAVTSGQCIDCHERANDRHPIYRFNEPRFADVLQRLDAASCLGCHSEHAAQVAFIEPQFCRNCHDNLRVKNDPIDVPHDHLIAQKQWESCLGCHDFHGNHQRKSQLVLRDAIAIQDIRAYLADGPSPYGTQKTFKARTE